MSLLERILTAVEVGDQSALRKLVNPSNVNSRDEDGRTLVMNSVLSFEPNPEVLQFLIHQGADVDAVDDDQNWTALHFATQDKLPDMIEILLKAGADPKKKNRAGKSALDFARSSKTLLALFKSSSPDSPKKRSVPATSKSATSSKTRKSKSKKSLRHDGITPSSSDGRRSVRLDRRLSQAMGSIGSESRPGEDVARRTRPPHWEAVG